MKEKTITRIIIIILIISQVWAFNIKKVKSMPNVLIVPSSEYPTIQEAINKANPGDTIFVREGSYYENVIVNKSVRIVGERMGNTIVDGQYLGDVIKVQASNTFIINLTIQNSGKTTVFDSGLSLVRVENITIQNCILRNNNIGVLFERANNSIFSNNIVMDNGWGFYLKSGSVFNIFVGNTLLRNGIGILLSSSYNKFYRNNFINSTNYQVQIIGYTSNQWDNGVEGNYWNDYTGVDENGDGIGDTELPIWCDYKPLVEPWSRIRIFNNIVVECDFTVASFQINQTINELRFRITGPSGWVGYFRVIIPKYVLNLSLHQWRVFLENQDITENVYISENNTHTFIYFEGTIAGNTVYVVPEFHSPTILLCALLITALITKRKIKLCSTSNGKRRLVR